MTDNLSRPPVTITSEDLSMTTNLRQRIAELVEPEETGGYVDYAKVDELRADLREAIEDAAIAMAEQMFHAFTEQVAPGLTCTEAERVVDLYRALGEDEQATAILEAHGFGDTEPDDQHYGLGMAALNAQLDASIEQAQS